MAIAADDDILQDFLVEAGELLEQLDEQLVELESRPDDPELLNAIFRAFHTVKGGAGFLGLEPMVELCHRTEDVFNVLRQGERRVDAELMDTVLKALDGVNEMFARVKAGEEPEPADPALLEALVALAQPAGGADAAEATPESAAAGAGQEGTAAQTPEAAAGPEPAPQEQGVARDEGKGGDGDEITDEEFEALLDELQGRKAGAAPQAAAAQPRQEASARQPAPQAEEASDGEKAIGGGDEITEEEFERLLDALHGPGRAPGAAPAGAAAAPAAQAAGAATAGAETSAQAAGASASRPASDAAPASGAAEGGGGRQKAQPPAGGSRGGGRGGEDGGEGAGRGRPSSGASSESTVRVDTRRLDEIMNLVGELVLVRNRLATLRSSIGDEAVSQAVANLDLVTSDLQAAVMKTRMQPIRKVFGRFPRVVRDLARSLNKEVVLELRGEETDLDKNLVEALADPLVHLVRNAVDHGIEPPDEREARGKPRAGTVVLAAAQEGDHILITITDDGRGMDPEALKRKAIEKGLIDEAAAARMDDHEAFNLIFAPGFSTKSEISDISGRGVGMDVVKNRIAQLNGTVEIDSRLGQGSEVRIKLPLTLAILPTLMVIVGGRRFAMPLSNVAEIFQMDTTRTNTVDGQLVVRMRGKAVPLYYLHHWLAPDADTSEADRNGQVVMAHVGNQRVGFVVDQVLGQEEVVIKPLGALLHGLAGFAGATITGDGRIALILDVPSLLRAYASRH